MSNTRPLKLCVWGFCLTFFGLPSLSAAQSCPSPSQVPYYGPPLIPGVSWAAWSEFLNAHWTNEQIISSQWFDEAAALKAAQQAPSGRWGNDPNWQDNPDWQEYQGSTQESFTPLTPAAPDDEIAYQNAAAFYHGGNFAEAIPLFDKVASDLASPYHAAAAYSAARAALENGNYADGFARITKILSDPNMQQFQSATYDLIGTMAADLPDAKLLAARLSEINHLLTAPPALLCQEPELSSLYGLAQSDLNDILYNVDPAVIKQIGQQNSLVDIAWTVYQPTPYTHPWNWISAFPPQLTAFPTFPQSDYKPPKNVEDSDPGLTKHARQAWLSTSNPLWAYALATRTLRVSDIPLIEKARKNLGAYRKDPAAEPSLLPLDASLFEQEIRILLMTGKANEALNLMRQTLAAQTVPQSDPILYSPNFDSIHYTLSMYSYITNGGARYYLEQKNFNGARWWITKVKEIYLRQFPNMDPNSFGTFEDNCLDSGIRLMLVKSWPEFIATDLALPNNNSNVLEEPAVLDMLPADQLISLSHYPGLDRTDRRALLSAGWIRLYMLGRWHEFIDLLPEVRDNFPELDTDIGNIQNAWTYRSRRHLVTKMLLDFPGLGPHVQWNQARDASSTQSYNYFGINTISNISFVDSHNPNDGNWWCAFDLSRAEVDVAGQFFDSPMNDNGIGFAFNVSQLGGGDVSYSIYPSNESGDQYQQFEQEDYNYVVAQSEALIKSDPLFKNIDYNELNQLSAAQSGPRMLGEQTLKWAKNSNWFTRFFGFDNQLPETLHLVVHSTRYGCASDPSWGVDSRQAYELLHENYPNSIWTRKTPYWFSQKSLYSW